MSGNWEVTSWRRSSVCVCVCVCVCVSVPCRQCSRYQQEVHTLLQSEPPELCTVWSECPQWSVCAGQKTERERGAVWLVCSYWQRKRRRWWSCLTTQHAFPRSAIFTLSLCALSGSRGLRTKSEALKTETPTGQNTCHILLSVFLFQHTYKHA